jgi:hypothetical protein
MATVTLACPVCKKPFAFPYGLTVTPFYQEPRGSVVWPTAMCPACGAPFKYARLDKDPSKAGLHVVWNP